MQLPLITQLNLALTTNPRPQDSDISDELLSIFLRRTERINNPADKNLAYNRFITARNLYHGVRTGGAASAVFLQNAR